MKNQRMFLKVTCAIFTISIIFCLAVINVSASGKEFKASASSSIIYTDMNNYESENENEEYISFKASKIHFSTNENITVSYRANSENYITDFDYTVIGFEVLSASIAVEDTRLISFELTCISDFEDCEMSINVTLSSGKVLKAGLYAVENEHGTFINPFSIDAARQEYFKFAMDSGFMTFEEYEEIWAVLSRGDVQNDDEIDDNVISNDSLVNGGTVATPDASSKETYVVGTLQWKDDAGVSHPLQRVMVRIYDKEPSGYQLLGTVYTDSTGYYSFTFDNPDRLLDFENGGYDIFVRAYAGDSNALVVSNTGSEYYWESELKENVDTHSTTPLSYTFTPTNDLGRAAQISQAILFARDYAEEMMGETPSDVTIRYPFYEYDEGNEKRRCFYSRDERRITITGHFSETGYPNSYASWDAIMHEYGHHIQYEMDIINTQNTTGKENGHVSNTNLSDEYEDRDYGIRLAWAEAWPTVFGTLAQHYYSSYLSNINTVCDTNYTSYNGSNFSIESGTVLKGEACEQSVASVLWDIYDSNNDAKDTIALGHESYWAITTGNQSKTFSNFIGYFYSVYPEYKDDIGANLSYYKMASTKPYILNSSSVSFNNPPSFTWDAQGGSTRYPNDWCFLIFYNIYGEEILRSLMDDIGFCQLDDNEWRTILSSAGKTYTAVVVSTNSYEGVYTGPYYSECSDGYVKPIRDQATDDIEVIYTIQEWELYKEFETFLMECEALEIELTFTTAGTRLLQTFTDEDTLMFLYSSNRVLLASDDDSGYNDNALISYDFEANVEYVVKVYFYERYWSDYIKLAVISSYDYSLYEEIFTGGEYLTSFTSDLPYCQTILVRHDVPYQQTLTLESHASFVTNFLVVCADSSFEILESDSYSFYEDEFGNDMCKASITFIAKPNVPYLIIIMPEDLGDCGTVTLCIFDQFS